MEIQTNHLPKYERATTLFLREKVDVLEVSTKCNSQQIAKLKTILNVGV
jgi:hypothetical protein